MQNKKFKTTFPKAFMAVLISIVFVACGRNDSGGNHEAQPQDGPVAVRVQTMDFQHIGRNITHSAHLQAHTEVNLVPASPGRIDKIHAQPAQRVHSGQVLVEMDQTQLIQAQVQLNTLEADYRRLDTLRRVGSISIQQYDQIKSQYEVAKTNVEFLKQNTRLLAPFSGVVSEKYFEDGEMYTGTPNTTEGKAAILTLMQTHLLKAEVYVAERFYPYLNRGMQVEITTDVFPGESFLGTVERIYPQINPATRTFRVEISIPNSGDKLKPGMFARASMEVKQAEVFVVPALAVLKMQGTNERFVFLEENGTARRVVVEPGTRYDDQIEIVSHEIKPGDKIIVAGHSRLHHGDKVSVSN